MACRCYLALSMTGRTGEEVMRDTNDAAYYLRHYGITPVSPAVEEGVKSNGVVLAAAPRQLKQFWKRDKELIRSCHVLLDLTGPRKSAGVEHEVGYMRYALWRPVVRIWPGLKASIAYFEDDAVVSSPAHAAAVIQERWGTWRKRAVWRAKMLVRCFARWVWFQIQGWR